jgi:hypothetical protein
LFISRTGIGPYTNQAKLIGKKRNWRYDDLDRFIYPACHGDWSFKFKPGNRLEDGKVNIYLPGVEEPLGSLDKVQVAVSDEFTRGRRFNETGLYLDQRIHMIPAAKCLVAIPTSADRLHIYRLDPVELMEKSGVDYMVIVSQPPSLAVTGEKFSYQVEARSKKGGLKFELVSGPQGMTMSPAGTVTWTVPATIPETPSTTVIVSIRDASGQERLHSFPLRVVQ